MKCFKGFCCMILSAMFVLCSSFSILAANITITDPAGSSSADVTAIYAEGTVTDVYSVDIEWGSMEFVYTSAGTKWNPSTHKYETVGSGTWSCEQDANKITVTNHSNKPVDVALSYTPASGYSSVSGAFGTASTTLSAAAENSNVNEAPSFSTNLTLSGDLPKSVTTKTKIGSARVTLSASASSSGGNTDSGNDSGDDDGGAVDTETPVGYVKLFSNRGELAHYTYQTNIFQQSANTYVATICAPLVIPSTENPRTEICINEVQYYIQKEEGYSFTAGTSVELKTTFFEGDTESTATRRETAVTANTTYTLTIVITGTGTATATLTEAEG